jgi:septal ring factor EnvC (AmiA/AmiB activator)
MVGKILLVFLLAAASGAQQAPDPREVELAEIRAEIVRLEGRLEQVKNRETGLGDRLQRVGAELELQELQLSEATAALELASARADATETRVGELEIALAAIRSDLKRRLAGMYRLGRTGYLRLFLTLRGDDNLLPAIRQLRFLVRRDQAGLERYRTARDQLEGQRRRLDAERREAEEWQRRERQRRDVLLATRRRHERLLAELEAQRRRLAARADELQDKERKLTRLIASLVEGSRASLAGTPIQEFRGALDWPARGEVTASFGPRRDPRYRTEVPHNGVDIETDPGTGVRAIFPGQVLYAAQFEGYGTMVVVYHPGRVFTLYAGLEELSVAKGDMVSLGDVLGRALGKLYFEIRVENQPEDPAEWLR